MNTTILKKCVDALAEKEPDISYIRGMLETLLALGKSSEQEDSDKFILANSDGTVRVTTHAKEIAAAEEAEKRARATTQVDHGIPPVGNMNLIKDLAEKSTEQA